jgi:hypothetical protein
MHSKYFEELAMAKDKGGKNVKKPKKVQPKATPQAVAVKEAPPKPAKPKQ